MSNIKIWSWENCTYCEKAKETLKSLGLQYREVQLSSDNTAEFAKETNDATTVPQIIINQRHIGGFDQLRDLIESGKLDAMIKG